jgi:hypothetical protein
MSWASVITALLTLAQHLLGWLRDKQLIDAGADAEIARQTLAILEMTEKGKAIKARIDAMSDGELDDFLKELGG